MTKEQRDKLITENHNIIYDCLRQYNLDISDFYDVAAIGMCKAADTYNETKGSFATYAYTVIKNTLKREFLRLNYKKNKPENGLIYYDTEYDIGGFTVSLIENITDGSSFEDNIHVKELLECLTPKLNSKEKICLKMILEGYRQADIKDVFGCTRQNVSLMKKKIERLILEYI